MTIISLEFPVLIESRQHDCLLSPLLMPGVDISRRRYGDAVRAYQKYLKKTYDHKILESATAEQLLWYRFSPDIHFELLSLVFKSGLSHIEGEFAVAQYQINGQKYVCLPKLEHLPIRLTDDVSRLQMIEVATAQIAAYLSTSEACRAGELRRQAALLRPR